MTFIPPFPMNPYSSQDDILNDFGFDLPQNKPSGLFEYYVDPNDPNTIVRTGIGGYPSIRYPDPTNIGTTSESTGGHQSGTGIVDRQIGGYNRENLNFPTLEEYTANPDAYASGGNFRIDTSLDADNVIDTYGRPTLTDNTKITNDYNKIDLIEYAIKNKLDFDDLKFTTHKDPKLQPYKKIDTPKVKKNLLANLSTSEIAFLAQGIGNAFKSFNAFSDAQSGTATNMPKQFPSAGLYRGDYA